MLFSSLTFLYLFLPAVLFFYYVVFRKSRTARNIFLFFASLFFYAWGEPRFVLVMIASILVNWLFGSCIGKRRNRGEEAKTLLTADIVFNLAILYIFKYLGFTNSLFQRAAGISLPFPALSLPIGISFFTFQAMSYVIDVYRGEAEPQRRLLRIGLYISFFPQLVAGPIVRYKTIADEIGNRKETLDDFTDGFARFVVGLSKKVLLANSFAILADCAFDSSAAGVPLSAAYSWLGAIAYTLQIFFDFSGYSDMAIGLGSMFGFHFEENFLYPYISTSVSEFWRRWHISLGNWFRDYLYIPLGGSRKGMPRTIGNLFVVWLLTGLWHGASITFVIWGLMYFVLIAAEKLTGFEKREKRLTGLRWVYTMFFVVLGWVVFRAESVSAAVFYLRSMFGLNGNPLSDGLFQGYLMQNLILLIIGAVFSTPLLQKLSCRIPDNAFRKLFRTCALVFLFILSTASLVSSAYNPFIYFQF